MKIYEDEKYVKLIPARYEPIKGRVLDLCDVDKKRLSSDERKFLELELLRHNLEMYEKSVFSLIEGHKFKEVIKVIRRDSTDEHRALFEGAPVIRISSEIALILNGGQFNRVVRIL